MPLFFWGFIRAKLHFFTKVDKFGKQTTVFQLKINFDDFPKMLKKEITSKIEVRKCLIA